MPEQAFPSNDNIYDGTSTLARSTSHIREQQVQSMRNRSQDRGDGGQSGVEDMRITRLEVAVEGIRGEISGLKHGQTMTLAAVGLVLASVIAFGVYTLQKVDALPAEIRGIADSITGAITATRSVDNRQPIIINVPPAPAVAPKEPEQPTKAPAGNKN